MNDAKTELIVIGTVSNLKKNTLENIEIGDTLIHWTSKIKFLGVYLNENLSLKDHVRNRTRKAHYNLRLIQNIWKYINIDTTKMLLSTLVLSQLDYVNSILSMAPATTIKPYQKIQNSAARVAYKKSKRDDAPCAYMNYIGCPLNTDALSNSLQLHSTLFREMLHNTLKRNYNESNFLG